MELIQGTHEASMFAPEDFISDMPDNVVTDILNRLPIQDAMRTSALSRNWRFKWTMLSQLVFDDNFFEYLLKTKHKNDYERIISRLLLNLKGPITKFVLYIEGICNDEDMAHWILFLSREGVKDLSICSMNAESLKLPTHLFSCLELKNLELDGCCFDPPASFHGLPNLLSLELRGIEFESQKLGEFFTQCPALEILELGYTSFRGQLKLVEIEKLANLKILTLDLCNLDNTASSSFIFELVVFLPKLQELDLDFGDCESLAEDGARKTPPITFPCLETLKLSRIDLDDGIMLSFAFEMIRSFPNLQTLEIKAGEQDDDPPRAICSSEVNYNTLQLLQLRYVVFTSFVGSENEVCLLKYLLACSPFLKKIVIRPLFILKSEEKLMSAKKLLKLHRASPVAEIIFE